MKKKFIIKAWLLYLFIVAGICAYSSPTLLPPTPKSSNLDSNFLLAIIAVVLLLPIYLISKTFLFTAKMLAEKGKKNDSSSALKTLLIVVACCVGSSVMAQEKIAETTVAVTKSTDIFNITTVLIGIIVLEALVIVFFGAYTLSFLKLVKGKTATEATQQSKPFFNLGEWWKKVNNFRPIEEEAGMDTGHDYDGIRELNNVTPSWFKAAFAISIIIAIIYMWRYHVSQSAPLQIEEYNIAMADAEKEKEEFLKNQSNNVDETTVKMLDAAGIDVGKTLFSANCAVCHGINGASVPGGVGPNLTDEYWLHGGSLSNIFRSIKLGWPDKGMRAWQDNFSPNQIAQLASYIKSISNTNLKGKDPQGEIYKEETAAKKDSTVVKKDTVQVK